MYLSGQYWDVKTETMPNCTIPYALDDIRQFKQ